ncbi:Alpha/Beta hydrolase protein [Lactarius quietus]|nr:Alpha/Beta hydrolase protein [Lactarius quietus]
MAFLRGLLVAVCAATTTVLADPAVPATSPTITLDKGKFIGTTINGTNRFLGIPFAQPPVGDLRFRHPQAHGPYAGIHDATSFGLSCPQQASTVPIPNGLPDPTIAYLELSSTNGTIQDGEDCLTLNVVAPPCVQQGPKLPVVVWIYGGGFENGATILYDGGVIVQRSIALGKPVIYVSMNYRLAAFGFLASQEVKDAGVGNLGLWDQRLALSWIQKYIDAFGGDPLKVTIWGQSAGAMSVSLQMLANGGDIEGLFRAAFMQSGSPTPVAAGDITAGQPYYDFLVENTGCSGSLDTLACLRAAPYFKLKAAMEITPSLFSYQSLALAWRPRVDGVFLVDDPQKLVQQGKVANIPFVTGDCDDEGTLFSFSQLNVTTEAELRAYLSTYFFPNVTPAQMEKLLVLYPQDVTQGSPYDTGTQNTLTPEFKRMASILGDLVFQAPRRFFLGAVSDKQNTWSYLSKRSKSLPFLGSAHGTDFPNIYGGGDLTEYLIQFTTNMDPNGGLSPQWPQYSAPSPQLMTFFDGPNNLPERNITRDTFRSVAIEFLVSSS